MTVKQVGGLIRVRHFAALVGFLVGFGAITFSLPASPDAADLRGVRRGGPVSQESGIRMTASAEPGHAPEIANSIQMIAGGVAP